MSTLLADVERFLAAHKMPPTRFGQDAFGDRHFVRQLRDGRRTWPETEAKVRSFMAGYITAAARQPTDSKEAA